MHEYYLAQCLIEEVESSLTSQKIDEQRTNKVVKVIVGFGPFTHATFDRIEFWWNNLLKGTLLEGTTLVRQQLKGKLFCPDCNEEFLVTETNETQYDEYLELFACPECNSCQTKVIEGTDILLLNIEIEIEVIE